jgi:hypothetical protein
MSIGAHSGAISNWLPAAMAQNRRVEGNFGSQWALRLATRRGATMGSSSTKLSMESVVWAAAGGV